MAARLEVILALGLVALGLVNGLEGLEGPGGTFRFGHVYWKRVEGNTVEFTIEAGFTRNVETSYFKGSAADGFAQVGDRITMTGRETPLFDFGDGAVNRLDNLVMTVIAYSEAENWILGSTTLQGHTYFTPNDEGNPWLAKFSGCCRFADLQNNADAPWVLTVEVDTLRARASPRVTTLPQLSVPYFVDSDTQPSFRLFGNSPVPETDSSDRQITHWELAQPWDVGQAAKFRGTNTSTVEVSLRPFATPARIQSASTNGGCGVHTDADRAIIFAQPGLYPGCMMRLLRGDQFMNRVTIESWVRVMRSGSKEGGVILSTGKESGSTTNTFGRARTCTRKSNCAVALIYINVNSTHVIVGHEQYSSAAGDFRLRTTAFSVRSSADLIADLEDPEAYPPVTTGDAATDSDYPLLNKWVHIAVVRKTAVERGSDGVSFTRWDQGYRVYVNGHQLEVDQFPACEIGGQCTGGSRPGGSTTMELSRGESNPMPGPRLTTTGPTPTPMNGQCVQDLNNFATVIECDESEGFANETALIIGGYRGADPTMAENYFVGELDEVRMWHGERSRANILSAYQTPLTPAREDFYGDNSKVTVEDITAYDSSVTSTLFALYNFDTQNIRTSYGACTPLGTGLSVMRPVYPNLDEVGYDTTTSAACSWLGKTYVNPVYGISEVVSGTGTSIMFYDSRDIFRLHNGVISLEKQGLKVGFYQVTVLGSIAAAAVNDVGVMENPTPRVPIDFIIEVVNVNSGPAAGALCTVPQSEIRPEGTILPCNYDLSINKWMPTISAHAATTDVGGNTIFIPPTDAAMVELITSDPNVLLRAYAGFEVMMQLKGNEKPGDNGHDNLFTNIGFTIGPVPATARFSTVRGPFDITSSQEFRMDMKWTPCEMNVVQTLCFDSVDRHLDPVTRAAQPTVSSEMICVNFELLEDPAPMFVNPPTDIEFTMGRKSSFVIAAKDDNCLDDVMIDMVGGDMPDDAMFHPIIAVSGGSCVEKSRTFEWTPAINTGGFSTTLMFEVQDSGGACTGMMPNTAMTSVNIRVKKCRYVVQEDMQLQELAAVLGMDWIRLWSLNSREPTLNHPDYLILAEDPQEINVGHKYTVLAPVEQVGGIMKRFGMTEMQVEQLNYDLINQTEVTEGMELCVVPNSCDGMRNTIYSSLVYQDGQFFAQQRGDSNPVPPST